MRYGVHDLHEYRGKFFRQLVRACINISEVPKGAIVFDPFCGSGTTLLEAILLGRDAIGVDSNLVACLISNAKIASYTSEDFAVLKNFLEQLDRMLLDKNCKPSIPVYKNMEY